MPANTIPYHFARQHLTARQLAFEATLKHIGSGAVAVILLVSLALLSAIRGGPARTAAEPRLGHAFTDNSMVFEGVKLSLQDFGNKCAADR
jgi:hypothetical protein